MTPIALCYLLASLATLIWPLLLLFGKRHVLGAQWLLMGGLTLLGICELLYSTFFNSFLQGEYLLVVLFMLCAMTLPLMAFFSLAMLTRPKGIPFLGRWLIIPPLALTFLMATSIAIGGADMYRLWMARSGIGLAGLFYAHSTRYNVIVAVHYYGFTLLLLLEMLHLVVYGILQLVKFRDITNTYFTSSNKFSTETLRIIVSMVALTIVIGVDLALHPFGSPRPLWWAICSASVEGALALYLGRAIYFLHFGAELIPTEPAQKSIRHNLREIAHQATQLIETDQAYLNPDLSISAIAKKLRVDEDEVVDSLYLQHGTRFADYVDGLRIDHATHLLLTEKISSTDPAASLQALAHRCGYLDEGSFHAAFRRVMGQSVEQFNRASAAK